MLMGSAHILDDVMRGGSETGLPFPSPVFIELSSVLSSPLVSFLIGLGFLI